LTYHRTEDYAEDPWFLQQTVLQVLCTKATEKGCSLCFMQFHRFHPWTDEPIIYPLVMEGTNICGKHA
jgi:hypothetical protein